MHRLMKLLNGNGTLYASFKEGETERIKENRFFHDMTTEGCRLLFEKAGLKVLEAFRSQDVREKRLGENWVNIIGKKN